MFKGVLLKESLANPDILHDSRVTKTETWQVQNAASNQPAVWTALSFEADASQAFVRDTRQPVGLVGVKQGQLGLR